MYGFGTGGMIHPGDTQQVSFFKSPDETVGIFTPGQMGALASPQTAFTGQVATKEGDRLWVVLMNIEANTRQTKQILDDIKASAGASAISSGSSYGGGSSSGSGQADQLASEYANVLATWRSNFNAAGIVGNGQVGYNSNGLGATPEQIARRIVYGMDTGGMIAPGDTQKVEFFKNPNERVIVARPDQFADVRSDKSAAPQPQPIVQQTFNVRIEATGGNVSKDSMAEMRQQLALAGRLGRLRACRWRRPGAGLAFLGVVRSPAVAACTSEVSDDIATARRRGTAAASPADIWGQPICRRRLPQTYTLAIGMASFEWRGAYMRDSELTERPGRSWTPWKEGPGEYDIERVWWAARVLHFAKLNVSCWFDGSDIVGIEHWGYRREKWCMKLKPAGWQPLPEVYRLARKQEQQAAVERFRTGAQARAGNGLFGSARDARPRGTLPRRRTVASGNARWRGSLRPLSSKGGTLATVNVNRKSRLAPSASVSRNGSLCLAPLLHFQQCRGHLPPRQSGGKLGGPAASQMERRALLAGTGQLCIFRNFWWVCSRRRSSWRSGPIFKLVPSGRRSPGPSSR
jgi:hypothetical protein